MLININKQSQIMWRRVKDNKIKSRQSRARGACGRSKNRKTKFLIVTATAFTFLIALFMLLKLLRFLASLDGLFRSLFVAFEIHNTKHPFLKKSILWILKTFFYINYTFNPRIFRRVECKFMNNKVEQFLVAGVFVASLRLWNLQPHLGALSARF